MNRFALAAVVAIVTVGCGGNSNAPTASRIPNVQGFYHGGYAVTSCVPTAFISTSCPPPGFEGPFNLRVTQSNQSLRAFVAICGSEINAATGSVGTDGVIALFGQDAVGTYSPIMLSTFEASVSGTSMTGTFACTIDAGTANSVSLTGTLKDVVFVSPDPNAP